MRTWFLCVLLAVTTVTGIARAQAPAQDRTAPQQSAQVKNPDTAADRELSSESEAAGENAQFKHSKSVVWISHHLGISAEAGYWLFVFINFAIVAGFIYWASRTSLAQAFRARTAAIQKGLEEARQASTEANARLQEVQARLSKLDSEVAAIRAAADSDFSAEEQRIKRATEEDARRVIEAGESEITAAAKSARRELKVYAAELAVELAKKEIKVDPQTDAALVRSFVSQLSPQQAQPRRLSGAGKDGK